MSRRIVTACAALLIGLALAPGVWQLRPRAQAHDAALQKKVDAVFSEWDSTKTPGCAVGVSVGSRAVLERAYGMADLERDVPNRPDTIFESGSVAKQFTAAAVLLLARDGKLSLDDPARRYLPELPDYGTPLTIRHMLHHTSGLRDWGTVAAIAGWPRTTRAHTHAHVLDIVSRQRALNFPPGTDWSYSNTGYNLAAILVSRVSGEPFAEFTRRRIFEPLGMSRTSWRDDHTRIVKGRAMAYAQTRDWYRTDMPFENVHGNGGMLTTVGDLLKWNHNFVEPRVGGADFVREQQQPGLFNDSRAHDYAFGLWVRTYKGLQEVYHSGSTASYRAFLTRFPGQHVSVGVLCNVSAGNATRYAHEVADLYLAGHFEPAQPTATQVKLAATELDMRVGLYRSTKTGNPLTLVRDGERLRAEDGPVLTALSRSRFQMGGAGTVLEFDEGERGTPATTHLMNSNGTSEVYERVAPARPTPAQLAEYSGTYTSDEAETTFTIVVQGGTLVIKQRPDLTAPLRASYADAFESSVGLIRFHRDTRGRVSQLSIGQERVWDLRFDRMEP